MPKASDAGSEKTAEVAEEFVAPGAKAAGRREEGQRPDAARLLRQAAAAEYEEVYGLKAAAIAVYPMYKGLARLVGMEIVGKAQTLDEQIDVLNENWTKYDFFFIHFKYTDSTGEDGNFDAKVKRIEEFDAVDAAHHGAEARRADRHRRPQHAELARRATVGIPCRRCSSADFCRTDGCTELRRKRLPPRRPRPVRSQVPDDAGPGQRRPAGQIRGVGYLISLSPSQSAQASGGPDNLLSGSRSDKRASSKCVSGHRTPSPQQSGSPSCACGTRTTSCPGHPGNLQTSRAVQRVSSLLDQPRIEPIGVVEFASGGPDNLLSGSRSDKRASSKRVSGHRTPSPQQSGSPSCACGTRHPGNLQTSRAVQRVSSLLDQPRIEPVGVVEFVAVIGEVDQAG